MICDKCGKTIADDSLFCPECGARTDGSITCKNCGATNQKQAEICVKCGVRLDGKEYCTKCGTLSDGVYCPNCGQKREGVEVPTAATYVVQQPVQPTLIMQPTAVYAKPKTTFIDGFRRVERILTPILLLFSILILFCCSFGVGVDVSSNAGGAILGAKNGFASKSGGILYFFGQSFMDTKALISAQTANVNYQAVLAGMQTSNVISLVAIILNLGVVLAALITAAIKTGIAFKKGEKPKIYKYAIIAFVVFFVCATVVKDANYAYIDCYQSEFYVSDFFYVSMSAGSVLGIFFSIGPIFLSFVLTQISLGKQFKSYDNLARVIPSAISVFFLLFIMGFMSESAVLVIENYSGEIIETEYTLASLLTTTFYKVLGVSDPTSMQGGVAALIIFYVAHLLNILIFGALLKISADLLFGEKINRKWILILSITAFAVCVAVSILPIIIYSDNIYAANLGTSSVVGGGLGAGITAPFIMSLLVLGSSITYFALNKVKSENKVVKD